MASLFAIKLLDKIAGNRSFSAGQTVFESGDKAQAIYRVITGEVQLYRYDMDGHRVLLHRAFSGDFFAEASLNSATYHCTACCASDTEVDIFSSRALKDLLSNNPLFQTFWIEHLSQELRRQRANVERLSLKSAQDRVTHFLMTEGQPAGEIALKGSLTEWADMLGLSRESLYRTLSNMQKNNLLERQGMHFRLIFDV